MFDIIVDSKIDHIRTKAQNGNFDSMVLLATYLQKGMHTRKNPELALTIFNYVLARKDEIPFKETYWNALCQKMHILFDRGEKESISPMALEMIRHMVQFPPREWDYGRLQSSVEWLQEHLTTGASELA
jgi:hypothetical protein